VSKLSFKTRKPVIGLGRARSSPAYHEGIIIERQVRRVRVWGRVEDSAVGVLIEEGTRETSWSMDIRRTKTIKNRTELNQKDSRCDIFYAANGLVSVRAGQRRNRI